MYMCKWPRFGNKRYLTSRMSPSWIRLVQVEACVLSYVSGTHRYRPQFRARSWIDAFIDASFSVHDGASSHAGALILIWRRRNMLSSLPLMLIDCSVSLIVLLTFCGCVLWMSSQWTYLISGVYCLEISWEILLSSVSVVIMWWSILTTNRRWRRRWRDNRDKRLEKVLEWYW